MALEVRVDRARCIGSRTCVYRDPEVFRLDDDNIAVVTAPETGLDDARSEDMLSAADDCPVRAITVSKDGERLT